MSTQADNLIFNDTGCICMEQLLQYRDGKLSDVLMHEVEAHLVDCNLCSDALEGLASFSNTETIDALRKEIAGRMAPSPSANIRPLLAAATIAGIIMFSFFTYFQFKNIRDERIAVNSDSLPGINHTPAGPEFNSHATGENTAAVPSQSIQSATENSAVNNSDRKDENNFSEVKKSTTVKPESMQYVAANSSSVRVQASAPEAKVVVPFSSAVKNNGNQNITYVDNVKVIDYNDYNAGNTRQADVPRSTASKYENSNEQEQAAAADIQSGEVIARKSDYLELVADPVILFNKGRYESANAGFDKLLTINSQDQNAAFYKGLSLFNLKKFEPALQYLIPLSNDSTSPFMEEARFYSAQAYISNGNLPVGKNILESIVNSNGFYSKKAKTELEKIK